MFARIAHILSPLLFAIHSIALPSPLISLMRAGKLQAEGKERETDEAQAQVAVFVDRGIVSLLLAYCAILVSLLSAFINVSLYGLRKCSAKGPSGNKFRRHGPTKS